MKITIISKEHSDKAIYKISSRKIFGSSCLINYFDTISDFINSNDSPTCKILLIDYRQLSNESQGIKEKFNSLVVKKAVIYIFDLEDVNFLDRNYLLPQNFLIRENLNQKTFETVIWRAVKHKLIKREYSKIYDIAKTQ